MSTDNPYELFNFYMLHVYICWSSGNEVEIIKWAHLNKAIMEEETEEGGAHAGLLGHGLRHDGAHDLLHILALCCIKCRRELTLNWARKQGHEANYGWKFKRDWDCHLMCRKLVGFQVFFAINGFREWEVCCLVWFSICCCLYNGVVGVFFCTRSFFIVLYFYVQSLACAFARPLSAKARGFHNVPQQMDWSATSKPVWRFIQIFSRYLLIDLHLKWNVIYARL